MPIPPHGSFPAVSMAFGLLLLLFLVAWAWLLRHWLKQERFWPLLKSQKGTALLWLASLLCLNPALTLLYALIGRRPPEDSRRPGPLPLLILVMIAAGFLVNLPGLTHLWMVPYAPVPVGHALLLDAKEQASASSTRVTGEGFRVACRTLTLVTAPHDDLARAVGRALRDRLARTSTFEVVTLTEGLPTGTPSDRPDLVFRLSTNDSRRLSLSYFRRLRTEFVLEGGTQILRQGPRLGHEGELPVEGLSFWKAVQHQSLSVGWEKVPWTAAAHHVAEILAKDLIELVATPLRERGAALPLPPAFRPSFQPFALPAPVAALRPTCLGAYRDLLLPHESVWETTLPGNQLGSLLDATEDCLRGAGWRRAWRQATELCMIRERASLLLRQRPRFIQDGIAPPLPAGGDQAARVSLDIYCRLTSSAQSCEAAIEPLMDRPDQEETLAWLIPCMSGEQKARLAVRLAGSAPHSTSDALVWTRLLIQYGHLAEAERTFAAARAWRSLEIGTSPHDSSLRSMVEELAKVRGKPAPQDPLPPLAASAYRAAGIPECPSTGSTPPIRVSAQRPATLFRIMPDGGLRFLRVAIEGGPSPVLVVTSGSPGHFASTQRSPLPGRGDTSRTVDAFRLEGLAPETGGIRLHIAAAS